MKVLKNNLLNKEETQSNYPKKIECEYCGSELEYEYDDMQVGTFGCKYLICPVCGYENYLDEEDDFTITKDTIEFPTHFYHFGDREDTKDIPPEEIKKWIQNGVEYFRDNKDEFAYFTGYGNTMLDMFNMTGDEEYFIRVARNQYEGFIPYEECDYAK